MQRYRSHTRQDPHGTLIADSRLLTRVAILGLVLLVTGCFTDKKQQLAVCRAEAIGAYPDEPVAFFFGRLTSIAISHHISECMARAGYAERHSGKCLKDTFSEIPVELNPHCYEQRGWLAWSGLTR